MEYLSRSRLPVFTPRLDLTAEDLNAQAETICAAINELAGRLFIIKDMIPEEERAQYAEEQSYPILDEIKRIWEDIQKAWETIEYNKNECDRKDNEIHERITELDTRLNELIRQVESEIYAYITEVENKLREETGIVEDKFDNITSDLEKRLNALDDAAARKEDLISLIDRIQWIRDNSLPKIGSNNNWFIGNVDTGVSASGIPGPEGPEGPQGKPFTYDDFTPEQLESLRGPAGIGVPAGGTTGQVLQKNSDIDNDTSWATIDLTNYYTKEEIDSMIGSIDAELNNIIEGIE